MQRQNAGKRFLESPVARIGAAHSMSGKARSKLAVFSLMAAFMGTAAGAQAANNSKPEPPSTPKVINIWPGVAPGSGQWKQKESTLRFGPMESVVNVTTPTLTAYLPDPAKATGTAVLIAPGGGFTRPLCRSIPRQSA